MKYIYILLMFLVVLLAGCGQNFEFESNAYADAELRYGDSTVDNETSVDEVIEERVFETIQVALFDGAMNVEMTEVDIVISVDSDILNRTEYIVEYVDGTRVAEEGALPYLEGASIEKVFASDDAVLLRYEDVATDEEFDVILYETNYDIVSNVTMFLYNYHTSLDNRSDAQYELDVLEETKLFNTDSYAFGKIRSTNLTEYAYDWLFVDVDVFKKFNLSSKLVDQGEYDFWFNGASDILKIIMNDGIYEDESRNGYYILDVNRLHTFNDAHKDNLSTLEDTKKIIALSFQSKENYEEYELNWVLSSLLVNIDAEILNERLNKWRNTPFEMLQGTSSSTYTNPPISSGTYFYIWNRGTSSSQYMRFYTLVQRPYAVRGVFFEDVNVSLTYLGNTTYTCNHEIGRIEGTYKYEYLYDRSLLHECEAVKDAMVADATSSWSILPSKIQLDFVWPGGNQTNLMIPYVIK